MSPLIDEIVDLDRENKTIDIVKRIGVITANRVQLMNHAADNPVTVFNSTILVENDEGIQHEKVVRIEVVSSLPFFIAIGGAAALILVVVVYFWSRRSQHRTAI